MTTEIKDIVIVGGGAVGIVASLALKFALPELNIALATNTDPFSPPDFDKRSIAYAPDVVIMLEKLGLWQNVSSDASPIYGMKIVDSAPENAVRIPLLNLGVSESETNDKDIPSEKALAYMVENRDMNIALSKALKASGMEVIQNTTISKMKVDASHGILETNNQQQIRARLIIGADGRNSILRRANGIPVLKHDYKQTAIVASLKHECAHENIAWQYFRPQGPLGLLPLNGNRSSIVWSHSPAHAEALLKEDPILSAMALEKEIGGRLGQIEFETKLQAFPLTLQIATRLNAPNLVLIGDAGHAIHPLAGQGLNIGFKDIAVLVDCLKESLKLGLSIEDDSGLNRFERKRRVEITRMVATTGALNLLFSNNLPPVRAIRDFGLNFFDKMPKLKEMMINEAKGKTKNSPELLSNDTQ